MDALPVTYYAQSTAYCLNGTMADGTRTRSGSVASNRHPLGQRLTVNGQRYIVRDRIGHGSELDIWMSSCADALRYGRRTVKVRVGWYVRRGRARKVRVHIPRKIVAP